MSRIIPAAMLTALGQDVVEPFFAVRLQFDGGSFNIWSGYGNRTINSLTYTGAGDLLKIDGLGEVGDMAATSATVSLNGMDSNIVSAALGEPYQGRPASIYFGVASVAGVVEVFSGFMDVMTIQDTSDTSTISLTIESKLVALDRVQGRRYTSESQKARYPNDTFFDYVAELADKEVLWGRTDENL